MWYFIWRTVKPFAKSSPQGCIKSTSRSQTKVSLWTLDFYYSVIPMVFFIWLSNTFSFKIFGSIKPILHLCLIYQFQQFSKYFTFMLKNKIFLFEFTNAHLCYYFKGRHPNETNNYSLFLKRWIKIKHANNISLIIYFL